MKENWKDQLHQFDEDTMKIMEIHEYFIDKYFPSENYSASEMMFVFFSKCYDFFEEEDIHHYSPTYIISAVIYAVVELNLSRIDAFHWVRENGYYRCTPKEAIDYFVKNYKPSLDGPFEWCEG